MNQHVIGKRYLALFFMLLVVGFMYERLWAQEVITAEVDRTMLSTDDRLTLRITVNGNNVEPLLPTFDGFQVVGNSRSSQVSIVNGNMSTQTVYQFTLQPNRVGTLTIDPISVTIDGQTSTTEPIVIEVSEGSAPPPPEVTPNSGPAALNGQDIYVEADVDKVAPYLGEQIVYTFRLYLAVNLFDRPEYQAPTFTGFWNQRETQRAEYRAQVAGRTYQVTELQTLLFPTVVGSHTIEPAALRVPGSLFQQGFTLPTQPVTVDVQPLPEPAPDDFMGAVGRLVITAEVTPDSVVVNEPVTLRVTVQGDGNIDNLPDPQLPEMAGWRAFEQSSTVNTQVQNGRISGSRVYEQLLVPTMAGTYTIPPISYTFFDPISAQYERLESAPLSVDVVPGASADGDTVVPFAGQQVVERLGRDIRHIKPLPDELANTAVPLTRQRGYWLLWALPLLFVGGHFGWRWQQARLSATRRSSAYVQAQQQLQTLRHEGYAEGDVYLVVAEVLQRYLSTHLGASVKGMTLPRLRRMLQEKGVVDTLFERLRAVLMQSEAYRFGPAALALDGKDGEGVTPFLAEVGEIIDLLEATLAH